MTSVESWALQAVEREAMRRALLELIAHPEEHILLFGLSPAQVHALSRRFSRDTGRSPIGMSANAILKAERLST